MLERPLPGQPAMQPTYAHSRTRTTSSNIFPIQIPSHAPMHLQQPPAGYARRSPSVNTFSTVSSSGMPPPPAAYRTSPTADIRRSTSTRSGSISYGTSYVALLRKQKATVWCDRSQHEDPQLLARQRAAKMRANRDIVGIGSGTGYSPAGTLSARTATGLSSAGGKVAAKIRHHGKPGVVGYSPGDNYVGVGGVPLRLSATEVEGEDSDEEVMSDLAAQMQQRLHHRRTGSSGRSSTASGRKPAVYRTSGGAGGLPGSGSQGGRRWSPGDTPERADSLADDQHPNQPHHHQQPLGDMVGGQDDAASGKARSTASGSSAERADAVPDMGGAGRLPTNSAYHAAITREKSVKTVDELKRRGSVDERTMTMSAGRLFIANPD